MSVEMKDSGIAWIGEIPKHWGIHFLSLLFYEHSQKNIGMLENNLLSLSYGKIKRRNIDDNGGLLPASFEGYNIISPDDIVFRLTDLQNDKNSLRTGLCTEKGIITSAYITIRQRDNNLSSKYFHYLLHSYDECKVFYGIGNGVRQGMNFQDLRKLLLLIPPMEEQSRIANFLDKKCAETDELIALQEQMIVQLTTYKQAVITESVTKGLDPNVKMKDSGVEWIGEIPEHWEMSRVGIHHNIILGKMLCNTPSDDSYTLESYYCAANVHFDGVDNTELKKMWFSPKEKSLYKVNENDLLVVEGGAGAGGCAIVTNIKEPIYVQNSIMIVRPKTGNVTCLKYLLESLVKKGYIDIVCNKATIPHFTKDKLSNVPYPVISLAEQQSIANYLDKKCKEIDELISVKKDKIEKLKAYKKSVIYEYVTGKKHVTI